MAEYLQDRKQGVIERGKFGEYLERTMDGGEHLGMTPELRRHMDPAVADMLGLETHRPPTTDEIANLLYGSRADGKELPGAARKISFVDFGLSPDKSVSLAFAFAPTIAEQMAIHQAHKDAVESTMEYVSQEIGMARRGHGGAKGAERGEIAWIGFDHFSSRPTVEIPRQDASGRPYTDLAKLHVAGDPHLHTHVMVPNVVLAGKHVGGLDLDRLKGRVREFGKYYQAHLATNLRRHGVDVRLDLKSGNARIAAIPDHARDWFSRRSRDSVESARDYASRQGIDWGSLDGLAQSKMVRESARRNRLLKDDSTDDWMSWKAQAAKLGWEHRSVLRPNEVTPLPDRKQRHEIAWKAVMPMVDEFFQRRAVVSGAELRVLAATGAIASGIVDPGEISAITAAFREKGIIQHGQATKLQWTQEPGHRTGPDRTTITTVLHESQERELVALVQAAHADKRGALTGKQLAEAVERSGIQFNAEQSAVQHEFTQGGRFAAAFGVAGAGKGTLLKAPVIAWERQGLTVTGIASGWVQTEELAGAGIEDRAAVAKFLSPRYQQKANLGVNSVVVLDEATQIGTRQLLEVMRLQKEKGFKLVVLAGPGQTQSVEAGSTVNLLTRALGKAAIPEVTTIVRTRDPDEIRTQTLLREGRAAEALAVKRHNGSLLMVEGGYRHAVDRTARLYMERIAANKHDPGFTIGASASTNEEAREISAAIRKLKQEAGMVGKTRHVLEAQDQNGERFDLSLAKGDHVRVFARLYPKGSGPGPMSSNGSVLTVVDVAANGIVLRSEKGREGRFTWNDLRQKDAAQRPAGRPMLNYGDVSTIFSSQSQTRTEWIDAMPNGTARINGFMAYVAESRQRSKSWMVVSDGAERKAIAESRPQRDARTIRAQDVVDHMAKNLSRQPTKLSALEFLDRARNLRHGAEAANLRGLLPGHSRLQAGKEQTAWHIRRAREHASQAARAVGTFAAQAMDRTVDIGKAIIAEVGRRAAQARDFGDGLGL